MFALYVLFLAVGLIFLIAGTGNLAYFLRVMAGTQHVTWGAYFIMIILSGVLLTVGLVITLYYFPLVYNPLTTA